MNIFRRFFKQDNTQLEERSVITDALYYNGYCTTTSAMRLSTVYRCVDMISDSVAQLPFEPYMIDTQGFKHKAINHPTYTLLNIEPNNVQDRFTYIKLLVCNILLDGNAYSIIERDNKGNAISLTYIKPSDVTINVVYKQCKPHITYSVNGRSGKIEPCNMIHLKNFTYDGIRGVSTISHAVESLGLSKASEAHAQGFFKGGANVAGILKVLSSLTDKQKEGLKTSWRSAFNAETGCPNGVAVLEGNMEFQPVTVKPSDAQLLETRQFNAIDICRFFNVNPVKAFDLSHSSYSTVEATQLAYLTDTLTPILTKFEIEFKRKLYKPSEKPTIEVKFDTSVLLRADKNALSNYYRNLFTVGAITPNEIRKQLDFEPISGGDKAYMQVNMSTLENINNNINNQDNERDTTI